MTDITKIINSINNNKYIEDDEFNITDIDTDKKNSPIIPIIPKVTLDNVTPNNIAINIDSEDRNNNESSDKSQDGPDMMNALKKFGSKTFRTHVIKDYVRPRMEKDIKECFVWREKWSRISNIFFSLSEFMCIVQTVMAFTSSSYDLKLLSFLAGMIGVLCISFNRFGTYAKNASSEKTSQLNEILITIGIKDKVPDLMDNDYGDGDKNK
jgi:hypothetical protein